ncbi:nucleotidyltransferase [Clostridium septicum]|uniref:tRNA(Met) cytidine acetate ligase n=1 Tax=Clostridium septicum TaxID=1504 RepID=A0ABY5AW31_CLOSE|nr:nucleotidyltransferase [Clostridium septicum]MDU1313486.1 nucleotidyltransferase [Clostridium septicum]QAS61276.1 nucleotidyltransferase [Clostridium septicum]UEC19373.1 nucleotidyltransferase [Clostridium septicum]USR99674.1 nucleotidyltransferase [Clostridium septicum]WLF68188.1 nucleotidyltransferase [Clostridium septicum]
MNITGIITEYNPFHSGHLYHLNSAKEITNCDGVICIMSGNFIQRGAPAIIDKWARAEMAIENGVDLVIELPSFYALSSAEIFAKGSVTILDSLGVVNSIFFGSESGNIEELINISKILAYEPLEFKNLLKSNLKKGITYAKARENSLKEFTNNIDISKILNNSNNILGIEYIKTLIRLNSNINPLTLTRVGGTYNDKTLNNDFSSATSIRESIKNSGSLNDIKSSMPYKSYEILKNLKDNNYEFVFEEKMFNLIKYKLISNCVKFNNLLDISEGLDKKILKEIYVSNSFKELLFNIKSKRYTYTKISRILTQIFIGLDLFDSNQLLNTENLYARILAFNSNGKFILKEMKNKSSIPIITKLPRNIDNPLLNLDIQSTKCYSILNNKLNPLSDYLKSPIIKH